jgi:C-terminal processing protease CtpA/Prc
VFAQIAKDTGFATLIGTTVSGGITSVATRQFGLNNSGIVVSWEIDYLTDQYGRSLAEFPTTPHYKICENSDALEVALAKIRDLDD